MIHLRYQLPLWENGSNMREKDGFRFIHVSNASLYGGQMMTKLELEGSHEDISTKKQVYYTLDTSRQRGKKNFTTVEGKPGFDEHHDFVMILTMFAGMIGSLQMI